MGLKNIYKKSLSMDLVRAGHDIKSYYAQSKQQKIQVKCLFSSIPMN